MNLKRVFLSKLYRKKSYYILVAPTFPWNSEEWVCCFTLTKRNVNPGLSYFEWCSLACSCTWLLANLHLHFAFRQSKTTLPIAIFCYSKIKSMFTVNIRELVNCFCSSNERKWGLWIERKLEMLRVRIPPAYLVYLECRWNL